MFCDEEKEKDKKSETHEPETVHEEITDQEILNDEPLDSEQEQEIDDDKQVITDILSNLGDFPVPEVDEVDEDDFDFYDDYLINNTETRTDTFIEDEKYKPKNVKSYNGKDYTLIRENFGYVCSNCDSAVSLQTKICPGCNVKFAFVKCEYCRYVGKPEEFIEHICPQCQLTPMIIPDEAQNVTLCTRCKRPYNVADMSCKLCGWVDYGVLAWCVSLFILVGFGIPLFSMLIKGYIGKIIFVTGVILGGILLFRLANTIILAFNRPKRFSFYWFCAIVTLLLLILG